MTRYAMLFAYDGTDFFGFARQPTLRTVQGVLEEKLGLILRITLECIGAGRTDAGVHADGQVISFDLPPEPSPIDWVDVRKRLNGMLGREILVKAIVPVPDDFNARFSATQRDYQYRLYGGPGRDPFTDRFALWVQEPFDVAAMHEAAQFLVGEHDFSSFCRASQRSMTRRLRTVTVTSEGERATIEVTAESFCHQLVRSLTGALLDVGTGRRDVAWLESALSARDRGHGADVAHARGLTLTKVHYRPDPFA